MRIENSFIPVRGVGEQTERRLWRRGVTHWDEFDGTGVGETKAGRIESFIREARTALDAGDAHYFSETFPSGTHWRLYENFRDEATFFDIETTGLSRHYNDVTTVSVHRGGETRTLVSGRDLTAEALSRELGAAPLLVSFNGKRFDVPFLESTFDVSLDAPHVDLLYPCRTLGLTGGLSAVERELGVERDRPDISGEDAVRLWHRYEAGDDDALDTLVSYNREDTVNMVEIMDSVTDALHERVFLAARDGGE